MTQKQVRARALTGLRITLRRSMMLIGSSGLSGFIRRYEVCEWKRKTCYDIGGISAAFGPRLYARRSSAMESKDGAGKIQTDANLACITAT